MAVAAVAAAGLFFSTCSVRRDLLVANEIGELVEDSPVNFDQIESDIPCQFGVPNLAFDIGTERSHGDLTAETEHRQVSLDGYYPSIEVDMSADVDGVFYNILSVLHDSQQTRTLLLVESKRA